MNPQRPSVDGLLLAELIDSVPGRVRKRLDNNPEAALAWPWTQQGETWSIACGEETVALQTQQGIVTSTSEVACSCLLSPRCFHVLACVSVLSSAASRTPTNEPDAANESDAAVDGETGSVAAAIAITPEMQAAARWVHSAATSLLVMGAQHAGLLLQSALLRAGHACRCVGLINLGNAVLRIIEGVQRLRRSADTADGAQLVEDLATAMELAHLILHASTVPQWVIGQSRRSFDPIGVRKLDGICAEPILTLSGYAGVCVYLQEANDHRPPDKFPGLYTINELRIGDSQLVHQAYRGGIELGSLSIGASEICRRSLAVEGLTASSDGRLGKGRSTRWALTGSPPGPPPGLTRFHRGRFGLPFDEQIRHVFSEAQLPADERQGGWDLVAFDATVIGPDESGLLVEAAGLKSACRLRIAIDVPELPYRENLQLIARCPNLRMRCLGRLRIQTVGEVDLLAVADTGHDSPDDPAANASQPNGPRLKLPASWEGLCNTGIDKLQRHYLHGIERWSEEVVLDTDRGEVVAADDGLSSLRRRLIGMGIGGRDSVPGVGSPAQQRDLNRLRRRYQWTAAQVVEDLATAASQHRSTAVIRGTERQRVSAPLPDVFLACHVYVREATLQFQRACWLSLIDDCERLIPTDSLRFP